MNNERNRIAKNVAQKRAQRCKHFNGVQHDKCDAGCSYSELQKAGALPCLPYFNKPGETVAPCDKFATYTPEEIAEQERKVKEHLAKMEKVMESIVPLRQQAAKTKTGFAGKVDCAACGGKQTLCLSISNYNGHARGKCTNCDVGWIE